MTTRSRRDKPKPMNPKKMVKSRNNSHSNLRKIIKRMKNSKIKQYQKHKNLKVKLLMTKRSIS